MAFTFINNFSTVTVNPLTPGDTTLELQDGFADVKAAVDSGDTLALTLFETNESGEETGREIVHVTAADDQAETLTIERGKEGTADGDWAPNTGVEQRLTAGIVKSFVIGNSDEPTSIVIGGGPEVRERVDCIILGDGAYADDDNCIVIGVNAEAQASFGDAIAIGTAALCDGEDSIAFGHGAKASDDDSIVIGSGATASDDDSVVIGSSCTSIDDGNVVVGKNARSADGSSVVVGNSATAADRDSVVIGDSASSSGDDCVVIGQSATGEADDVIAIGEDSRAAARDAIAVGQDAAATGEDSIAIGEGASGEADDSVSLGKDASATAEGAVAIGEGADTRVPRGLQFGATSYVPLGKTSQNTSMPSVVASEGIDISSASSSATVEAPEGMAMMVDSIEFVVSKVNSGYAETARPPEGISSSNAGGFMIASPGGEVVLYADGAETFLLDSSDMSAIAGAPTSLAGIKDAAFSGDGNYLAVVRDSDKSALTVYNTSDWSEAFDTSFDLKNSHLVAFDHSSRVAVVCDSAGQYEINVFSVPGWTKTETEVFFWDNPPNDIAFSRSTMGILSVTDSATMLHKEGDERWDDDPLFPTIPGGAKVYSTIAGHIVVVDSDGTGAMKVYDSVDYSPVSAAPVVASSTQKTTSLGVSGDGKTYIVGISESPGIVSVDATNWGASVDLPALSSGVSGVAFGNATGEIYAARNSATEQPIVTVAHDSDSFSMKVGSTAGGDEYASSTQVITGGKAGTRVVVAGSESTEAIRVLHGSLDTLGTYSSEARFVVRGYFVEV